MKNNWKGVSQITEQQRRRKYKLHYNLRKKGNIVITKERMVVKRLKETTEIENRWLNELIDFGYGITESLFANE